MLSPLSHPIRFGRWHAVLLVVLLHAVWILATSSDLSYVKDEGYYFSAAAANFRWYGELADAVLDGDPARAFTTETITRFWNNNSEHPPLCKIVQGATHALFTDTLGWCGDPLGFRLATLIFSSVLAGALFLLFAEWAGGWIACAAMLLLYTMPHFFFHDHLATFDMPVTALWILTACAFRKSLDSPRWAWVTGLLLGLGIAAKNNAVFLPVLFAILYLGTPYRGRLWGLVKALPGWLRSWRWPRVLFAIALVAAPPLAWLIDGGQALAWAVFLVLLALNVVLAWACLTRRPTLPTPLAPILSCLVIPPFVFAALWPWIWVNTWSRLGAFLLRHLNPPAWETYYLHTLITNPPPYPMSYPFVMSFFTLPISVLFLFALGAWLLARRGLIAAWLARRQSCASAVAPLLARDPRRPADSVVTEAFDVAFIGWNILLPVLIIASPQTPVYGGTKHYMAAMPFVAFAAALALRHLIRLVAPASARGRAAGWIAAVALALVPGALGIYHSHPVALGYYNELMGGSPAAPEIGMQRFFWAAATRQVLPSVNRLTPPGGHVYFNNTPFDVVNAYRREGALRHDIIQVFSITEADVAVMSRWRYYEDGIYEVRALFDAPYADAVYEQDGQPLAEVFVSRRRERTDGGMSVPVPLGPPRLPRSTPSTR